MNPPSVHDRQSALDFVRWCVENIGGGFHPDDSGHTYVNLHTGVPTFTPEQAAAFEDARDGLFAYLPDDDMYAAIEDAENALRDRGQGSA